jgi:hypothetical protein
MVMLCVTSKATAGEVLIASLAVMICRPPEAEGMVIIALEKAPLALVMAIPTLVASNRMEMLELGLNPVPLTEIWSSTRPESRLNEIFGSRTSKVTPPEAPIVSLPVIACVPAGLCGTVNEILEKVPLALVKVEPILVLSNKIDTLELALKPEPLTLNWLPEEPESASRVISGVIVKYSVLLLSEDVITLIAYCPLG